MSTIAFDIGVKNLSYCCLNEFGDITQWDVINVTEDLDAKQSKDFHSISHSVFENLQKHFNYDTDIAEVIIENQPVHKNPTMKSIQMLVYSFFGIRNLHLEKKIKLHFIAASTKVKLAEKYLKDECDALRQRYTQKYTYNKKVSVQCVEKMILENSIKTEELISNFKTSKKKDDLADALLLALVHRSKKK